MTAKKKKILIVEDEQFLADMYQLKFEQAGLKVLQADDGRAGLLLSLKEKPDLILLDIVLPQMNGFEMLTELKKDEQTKNIPVLIFSNLGQKDEIARGISLGADAYVVKANYTPAQLIKHVRKLIE